MFMKTRTIDPIGARTIDPIGAFLQISQISDQIPNPTDDLHAGSVVFEVSLCLMSPQTFVAFSLVRSYTNFGLLTCSVGKADAHEEYHCQHVHLPCYLGSFCLNSTVTTIFFLQT